MFLIVEIQTNGSQMAQICQTAETYEQAMSKYHTVLASASVSGVECHSCVVLNKEGSPIARESYTHGGEPEGV